MIVLELNLQVQRILPVKSLSCKVVTKRSSLSLEGFLRDYILPGAPVIISDGMAHWPATSKWNDMNYLKRVAGFRTVPVEVIDFALALSLKASYISFLCVCMCELIDKSYSKLIFSGLLCVYV